MPEQFVLRRETNLYDDEAIAKVNDKVVAKYATCTTASSMVAKIATIDDDFVLYKGARISVYFANANTSTSPTLDVNNTGAKPIWAYGGALSATGNTFNWVAKSTIEFVYDGDHWLVADSGATGLVNKYDEKLNQEVIFNKLTNNGTARGIFLDSNTNQLYINMDYLQTGTIKLGGANNGNGLMVVYDSSGTEIGRWDKSGLSASGELTLKGTYANLTFIAHLGSAQYRPLTSSSNETLYGMLIEYNNNKKIITPRSQIEIINNSISSVSSSEAERMILLLDASPNNSFTEKITANQYDAYFLESYSSTGAYFRARFRYNNDSFYWSGNSGGNGGAKPKIEVNASSITIGQNSKTTPYLYIVAGSSITSSTQFYFKSSDGSTSFMVNSQGVHYNGLRVHSSSSSKRYKHDITDRISKELDAHKLYKLQMKQFVFNDDSPVQYYGMKGKTLPGFIAEDVAEIYPAATIYNAEGVVESWDERRIIPAMLTLIQEQNEKIKKLEEKLCM